MPEIKKRNIVILFINWFFIKVPKDIFKGWINFLRFNLYYFSIGLLLRTCFSPWRGFVWKYPRGLSTKHFEVFFSNVLSRLLGFIMRILLIFIGIIAESIVFLTGIIVILLWYFSLPLLIAGFYLALNLI